MAMAFIKSLPAGALLSWLMSIFIGSAGSTGGLLNVRWVTMGEVSFYWSWPTFLIGAGITFAIIWMMDW